MGPCSDQLAQVVGVCQEKVEAGDRLAVLPLNSPVVAAIREMEGLVVPMQGNVKTTIVMCQCGSLHALVHSSADLCPGDILVPSNACEPHIMVQFDGSAHRNRGVGGAGAALLQVECSGLALLDWEAQALPVCADDIVAETHGADLALSLYEKYRQLSQQQSITPLPLDRIQGDIKPLLQHLDFRGRFRRKDLINLIHQFHTKRSRIAPNSITEYRPREANTLADYFAGQASAWLLQKGNLRNPTVEQIAVQADPPYDLLQAANAVLLGPHKAGKIVLILREKPGCFFFLVSRTRHHSCAGHCSTIRSHCNFIRNATIPPGRNTQQKNTKPTATKQKTNNATPTTPKPKTKHLSGNRVAYFSTTYN